MSKQAARQRRKRRAASHARKGSRARSRRGIAVRKSGRARRRYTSSNRRLRAGGGSASSRHALQQLPVEPPALLPPVPEGMPGVQLVGFNRSDSGLGEACRLQAASLISAAVPTSIMSCDSLSMGNATDFSLAHLEIPTPVHKCTILQFNPDYMPHVLGRLGHQLVERKYTIGYWHWEMTDIPDNWADSWPYVREIWTPSRFVRDVIAARSPVPVLTLPYGISAPSTGIEPHTRAMFGLPENSFLFLTMFDTHSFIERKNPMGTLNAFLQAFGALNPSVGLVLKANHAGAGGATLELLKQRLAGCHNVYWIEAPMTRQQTAGLIECCDAYVSLHRAEGFGLAIAEAMAKGKPVIATDWSGNTDFLNAHNGCPVRYTLVSNPVTVGPYQAGSWWAEPDLRQASNLMQQLVIDRRLGQRLGAAAAQTIASRYNPAALGAAMRNRLMEIGVL
ncbi:glycosyltransferase involved in cell wall biosynthesis [Paenibacillus cellulosilyticus]|uniref:Glycosyltransferase involved in cell wall biosynthesis n=1 Tax=Paenibacillus cellulosilyticus TaxID=375489 RepID=A0A2V2Z1U2_9BACL|nr:glycosyltransferase family 4 protein [Paenibacillus cellulosilyticus]PWW07521.1 glycosyltransferase involved in cell wall biosynthesis [Paenibacillus cellulosilyticus]QKS44326.1 glycosyltransferase family 4 protein [Paenibacillus cellulosilyticus]